MQAKGGRARGEGRARGRAGGGAGGRPTARPRSGAQPAQAQPCSPRPSPCSISVRSASRLSTVSWGSSVASEAAAIARPVHGAAPCPASRLLRVAERRELPQLCRLSCIWRGLLPGCVRRPLPPGLAAPRRRTPAAGCYSGPQAPRRLLCRSVDLHGCEFRACIFRGAREVRSARLGAGSPRQCSPGGRSPRQSARERGGRYREPRLGRVRWPPTACPSGWAWQQLCWATAVCCTRCGWPGACSCVLWGAARARAVPPASACCDSPRLAACSCAALRGGAGGRDGDHAATSSAPRVPARELVLRSWTSTKNSPIFSTSTWNPWPSR